MAYAAQRCAAHGLVRIQFICEIPKQSGAGQSSELSYWDQQCPYKRVHILGTATPCSSAPRRGAPFFSWTTFNDQGEQDFPAERCKIRHETSIVPKYSKLSSLALARLLSCFVLWLDFQMSVDKHSEG